MKKLTKRSLVVLIILLPLIVALTLLFVNGVKAEDSKEVLTLKRDLAQERVLRLQSQLSLMQQQFAEGQKYLQETQKELTELSAKLTAMEPKKPEVKKEEKPKVEEKKK